jgi:hypothetical protein
MRCTSIGCAELDEPSVRPNILASRPSSVDLCGSSTEFIGFSLLICKSETYVLRICYCLDKNKSYYNKSYQWKKTYTSSYTNIHIYDKRKITLNKLCA